MRHRLIIIIGWLFVFYAFGQAQKPWPSFNPANEEFSVEVPTGFESYLYNPSDKEDDSRRYSTFQDPRYYFIFSDSLKKPSQVEIVLRFLGQEPDKIFQNSKYVFKDTSGYQHDVLIIKTEKRIYTFQMTSLMENDERIQNFFDSIKINGQSFDMKGIKTIVCKTGDATLTSGSPTSSGIVSSDGPGGGTGSGNGIGVSIGKGSGNGAAIAAGNGNGTGSGMGNGNGNGVGSGIGSGTGSGNGSGTGSGSGSGGGYGTGSGSGSGNLNSPATIPLKIMAKPKGLYTDAARFYQIMGTVRVRVTFMADGTIGSVHIVKGLPFGLNEQAIASARGIRFEPQKINSTPVSVTKMVDYGYMLY